jgi:hypothetical protein
VSTDIGPVKPEPKLGQIFTAPGDSVFNSGSIGYRHPYLDKQITSVKGRLRLQRHICQQSELLRHNMSTGTNNAGFWANM